MTEEEQSTMWKEAIEKSLQEVQELRDRLHPIEFPSPLWDVYHGAYGDIREDVAFLFCPSDLVPEMDKIRRLDFEEKTDEQINFDNLCENLLHQLSFYDATFLAMPYLVLLLEKKRRANDLSWQLQIIIQAGAILSTVPSFDSPDTTELPKEVSDSYQASVEQLKKMTKEFLKQNFEQLKKEDPVDLQYFSTALLAILDDSEAASQLLFGYWEQLAVTCPECDYFVDIELDGEETPPPYLQPAESVLGKWDGESFQDTYLWFSNLAHELGINDEWKIPYFYGTYTCPECGKKSILMDGMKQSEN